MKFLKRSCELRLFVATFLFFVFEGNFLQPDPVISPIFIGRCLKYSIKDSLLRVAAIAMTDDKRNIFSVFSRIMHGKCSQNFPYKACQLYSPLKRYNILGSSFCPMCIDNNISRYVISNFITANGKVSEKNKIKWEVIETYLGI